MGQWSARPEDKYLTRMPKSVLIIITANDTRAIWVQCYTRHILNNDQVQHSCCNSLMRNTHSAEGYLGWQRTLRLARLLGCLRQAFMAKCFMATMPVCGDIMRYFAILIGLLENIASKYRYLVDMCRRRRCGGICLNPLCDTNVGPIYAAKCITLSTDNVSSVDTVLITKTCFFDRSVPTC